MGCIHSIMLIFLSVKLASEIYQCLAGGVFLASPIEECVPSASSLPKVLTSGPVSLWKSVSYGVVTYVCVSKWGVVL